MFKNSSRSPSSSAVNAFHYSVQRLPRNSRLIAMFRPRPALALLFAHWATNIIVWENDPTKIYACWKIVGLYDQIKTSFELAIFSAIYVDLIDTLVSYIYVRLQHLFLQKKYLKSSMLTYFPRSDRYVWYLYWHWPDMDMKPVKSGPSVDKDT